MEYEAKNYGKLVSVKIPRPLNGKITSGVGNVYIQFSNVNSARVARRVS